MKNIVYLVQNLDDVTFSQSQKLDDVRTHCMYLFWLFLIWAPHTVVLWLICRHREIGNSTYMKVILTKNLNFITIIYHTKFQFVKMSRTMKEMHFFPNFLVHKNHRNSENYIFFIVLEINANWNFVW
jgi:hypothetical protein